MVCRSHYLTAILFAILFSSSVAAERPNVVLFIADDVSWNDFGCYGNEHARTPHIDRLAASGIRFDQAYLTASSCSPSRASIVTGRYPHNNGKAAELHLPIASHLPWFPELLRSSGYYTALSGKNHMSASKPSDGQEARPKAFELINGGKTKQNSGGHASWVDVTKSRPKDKPFFFWFAANDAHRGWDADRQWDADKYGPRHTPENVVVPPFLIDNDSTRQDLASYYNEVTRFDHYIGQTVAELKSQGVLDNTLIFVLADNGRPFPRAKTRLHDSGMKTALVAHWPMGIKRTGAMNSLVSVIDLAPTVLSAAGVSVPQTMQGVSLQPLLDGSAGSVRKFAFSEHNWHDYEAHGRSVRDGKFLMIRNKRPARSWQGPADSVRSPSHAALQSQRDTGKLTGAQADVFLAPRPSEELYLVSEDPHQLHNLIDADSYKADAMRLGKLLDEWTDATADSVPAKISGDFFDRETGKQLKIKQSDFRALTPGEDRGAENVNATGPR